MIGLDLGGTKLLGMVVDPTASDPIVVDRVATPSGGDAVIEAIVDLVGSLRGHDAASAEPAALGLGAPGLIDRSGTLRFGPNVAGIENLAFGEILTERTGLATVVENDATCAAWAEHERGAARGANHSLTVTLGTGIGAGITVKGELLRGAHGFAGEPGHMVVDPSGPLCPCGRRGCWERYASGSGLGALGREAAIAGRAPRLVELADGEAEAVRGEHVTAAAADGDEGALEVVRRFAWWVALGIANLVNVLDSEIVVIGGGLVEAGDVLLDPIRAAFDELVFGVDHRDPVSIVAAELGERAGAWGAALLAAARS